MSINNKRRKDGGKGGSGSQNVVIVFMKGFSVVGNSHKENIKQGRIEKYPATTDLAYYRNLVADSARARLFKSTWNQHLKVARDLINKFYTLICMSCAFEIAVLYTILCKIYIDLILFLQPEDIEIVLSSTKHTKKSYVYDFLNPWLRQGLLTSFGRKWQSRRKILTPAFHFNILQQFVPIFEEQSQILVRKLEEQHIGKETNIVPLVTEYTLHTICETAMGLKIDQDNSAQTYKQAVCRQGEYLVYRSIRPWLFNDIIFGLTRIGRKQKSLLDQLHSFTCKVINKRKEDFLENIKKNQNLLDNQEEDIPKKRLAMLDLLLKAEYDGADISDVGIREEVDTFMFEGHDTSSMAITYSLMCFANNPEVQKIIVEELTEIFGDSDRSATTQDLQKMQYLERCIKEVLRLYPSVPLISRYNEEPLQLSKHLLPAGQTVHIHIFDLHRDATIYPEPERFDPDRFLPEQCAQRHPFAYIPFSAGPRNCIGQKFVLLEMKSVLSGILRKYTLSPITRPQDITFLLDLVLRPKDPIKVKFTLRK
ncbi:cytochrome P450 4C1-like [Ctenocephalides felis]|uniref:cytochrome P450 4C1-like n=1 Tax=Ctenocephalides felis TaxID=7515 RepID=UPI000E6E12D6|nr:cytochrome P450 4C1-like [Ctenocephalides felis]